MKLVRKESQVFDDLQQLCTRSGFVHILSFIATRDCFILSQGELKNENFEHWFSQEKLLRTEIATLHGLLLKADICFKTPTQEEFLEMLEITDNLMKELHNSMFSSDDLISKDGKIGKYEEIFTHPNFIKESIFYSSESAYPHQFLELATKKYKNDDQWIVENKGFSISEANEIIHSIQCIILSNVNRDINTNSKGKLLPQSYLTTHTFTIKEINDHCNVQNYKIEQFLNTFSFKESDKNNEFNDVSDFNKANELPIIKWNDKYILFQTTSLLMAFYENPVFWFMNDKPYIPFATKNRGFFAEELAYERLENIFGKDNVFINLDLYKSNSERICEIDVLVLFGSRAIVLQAKSKSLTIKARKGDKDALRSDFNKSIQSAYEQALLCGKAILDNTIIIKNTDGQIITLDKEISEIYPMILLSEHFPSLLHQTRHQLIKQSHDIITDPLILDVFTLDIMAHFLSSPLYFLSYVNRRCNTFEKISANHELTILSFHLKHNLWIKDDVNLIMLQDDISVDLEIAMICRTQGGKGSSIPRGILTELVDTPIGNIISELSRADNKTAVKLGLKLLEMSGNSLRDLSRGINYICYNAIQNNGSDFSIGLKNSGITFHANTANDKEAIARLEYHMEMKKYQQKTKSWFGILLSPITKKLRLVEYIEGEWKHSKELEKLNFLHTSSNESNQFKANVKFKIRRNDKCFCGSGLKYKKCCGK